MANSMAADVHKATTLSIALAVLMIAAGVLAICVPLIAGVAVRFLSAGSSSSAVSSISHSRGGQGGPGAYCGKFCSGLFTARSGSTPS
jgi:hypothetical protein